MMLGRRRVPVLSRRLASQTRRTVYQCPATQYAVTMTDEDGGGQIEFRVVYKRRRGTGTHEDDSRWCRAIVKVEPRHMREFGIRDGEVVRITGGARSTAAICLPMSESGMQDTDEPEVEIEFLNDPGRKARRHPRIMLHGHVSCNVDVAREWLQTVFLSRFPKPEVGSEGGPEAEVVTLGTVGVAEKMMPGYRSNLDYSKAAGLVVTENDRIDVPFQKEWIEKMLEARKWQETDAPADARRLGRTRSRAPPFPESFQSVVTDVKPEGMPFWLVTEKTRFEFKDGGLERVIARHVPASRNLVGVIPISRQISMGDTVITVASLEVYPDTMKMIWYSHQHAKIPESDFTDARVMSSMGRRMRGGEPRPVFSLEDDLGNRYASAIGEGGGGSSGPDPATMEMVSNFSWSNVFSPGLDARAREIVLTVKEVQWMKQEMTATEWLPPPTERPHVEPAECLPTPKVVIAEGPWRFSIPVSWQGGQLSGRH